jgi:hypothetical protein
MSPKSTQRTSNVMLETFVKDQRSQQKLVYSELLGLTVEVLQSNVVCKG